MNTDYILSRTVPLPGEAVARRARPHVADLLLPAGIALWAFGISRTNVSRLGPYGLPAVLPLVFYAGVIVIVLSATAELASRRMSTWRMSLHAVALVTVLYGTAPLVYSQGRYSWLYKTIGVVQYVSAHGQLNRNIDIYQNWPGFFALAAWFGKVAGVTSPLAYAKWAQLMFELAMLPLLYLIYSALSLTARQRWVAILLFSASNWIGQDYLSPQALGTLLSLGVMAIVMRWLYVERPPRRGKRISEHSAGIHYEYPPRQTASRSTTNWPICIAMLLIYFVLTFTHELSPYMLLVQIGTLAVFRRLRPRWMPIGLAVIAIGYLLPRFSFVNTHFGLLKTIGTFLTNLTPPSFNGLGAGPGQHLVQLSAQGLSIGIWGLAILGGRLRRQYGQPVLGQAFLAFSPIMLVAFQAYGHEGILRAYLFSLPWSAALAAFALAPPAARASRHKVRGGLPATSDLVANRPGRGAVRIPVTLVFALSLFFPAFFGDDRSNVMSAAEVSTVTSFLNTARVGPLYCALDHAPLADTARYDLFPVRPLFGSDGDFGSGPAKPDIARVLARIALKRTGGNEPAYVIITPSMLAYSQTYEITSSSNFTILRTALAHSRHWQLIASDGGTVIYKLR